jgi:2-dehydropantoate 2-reductase
MGFFDFMRDSPRYGDSPGSIARLNKRHRFLIKPYVAADGVVVGLQNGMTAGTVLDVFGPARALGAVIEVSSAMYTPGVVERHTPPSGSWFALGHLDEAARGKVDLVAGILRNAGTVEVTDDVLSSKWMKLVVNCAELVPSAILGLPLRAAAEIPGMYELMLEAGREAIRTGVELGHRVTSILGLPVDADDPEASVQAMFDEINGKYMLPHTRTTVLQDWMKERHSEVDEINGLVVDEAVRLGGKAPVNARVVEVAHRVESGELELDPSNAELLLA